MYLCSNSSKFACDMSQLMSSRTQWTRVFLAFNFTTCSICITEYAYVLTHKPIASILRNVKGRFRLPSSPKLIWQWQPSQLASCDAIGRRNYLFHRMCMSVGSAVHGLSQCSDEKGCLAGDSYQSLAYRIGTSVVSSAMIRMPCDRKRRSLWLWRTHYTPY